MVLLQGTLYFSKAPEGVQHFKGEVQLFSRAVWGPNGNFYRNPYKLLFSKRGVRTSYPPSGSGQVCYVSLIHKTPFNTFIHEYLC